MVLTGRRGRATRLHPLLDGSGDDADSLRIDRESIGGSSSSSAELERGDIKGTPASSPVSVSSMSLSTTRERSRLGSRCRPPVSEVGSEQTSDLDPKLVGERNDQLIGSELILQLAVERARPIPDTEVG